MSEDRHDRTEAPTPKRRQDAKRKGQVPKSQELTTAILLISAAFVVHITGGRVSSGLTDLIGMSWAAVGTAPVDLAGLSGMLEAQGTRALGLIAPPVLAMAAMALVIAGAQARGVLSLDPIKAKGNKLNPIENAKRVWGMKALVELVKSLGKFAVITGVTLFLVWPAVSELPVLTQMAPMSLLAVVQDTSVRVLAGAGVAYLVIAAIDYGYQLWRHEQDLRMSREDVKKEQKETDGDPNVKARRRSMSRALARRRMLLAVSDADVVITNPIHLAVALKYDPERAPAPFVLAKGERKVAQRIKEIAGEGGIPVVEDKPLARALYASAEVDEMVPVGLYVAVAEILAFVFRQRGRSRSGIYAEA